MSERRPFDRPPSPDTLVVDLDEIEEFDFDAAIVPPEPASLAQGSETHDRSEVARRFERLPEQELDAILIAYLLDKK
jgi:hypothetical protein